MNQIVLKTLERVVSFISVEIKARTYLITVKRMFEFLQ